MMKHMLYVSNEYWTMLIEFPGLNFWTHYFEISLTEQIKQKINKIEETICSK